MHGKAELDDRVTGCAHYSVARVKASPTIEDPSTSFSRVYHDFIFKHRYTYNFLQSTEILIRPHSIRLQNSNNGMMSKQNGNNVMGNFGGGGGLAFGNMGGMGGMGGLNSGFSAFDGFSGAGAF